MLNNGSDYGFLSPTETFLRSYRHRGVQKAIPTMFSNIVYDGSGRVKHVGETRPNLRTNIGIDWQASVMGDYRYYGGTATGATATTLTATGTPWVASQWIGHVVVALVDVNTIRYGVVLSNTTSALTIDQWYDFTGSNGASGTTPSTTTKFVILPGGAPHWWMALSTTVQSGAVGDTTLAGEITTGTNSGLARSLPTSFTHSAGVNTYSIAKTFTSAATSTVNSQAVFDAQNAGRMPFESAEPNAPTLVSGDTLAQTITVTI